MTLTRPRSLALSLLFCSLGAVAWLHAGPLNPPAGPVASSYKTLSEIEPRTCISAANTPGDADSLYKITQPGSYYLTGNITGVAAKHGIEIVASGVTLDLSGFELLGLPGSLDGVSATVGLNNVTVRDGSVASWGDEGLDFTNGGSIGVEDVSVISCAGFGISINQNSTAARCRANFNGAGGIATGSNCVVTACTANGNNGGGILAFVGCRVVDSTAMTNTGNGISASNGSTISGCAATDNTVSGFSLASRGTISDCSASSNDSHGISGGDGVAVTGCSTTSNFGHGISLANGATVTSCVARSNAQRGISLNNDPTVTACNASANGAEGIRVISGGTVRGCTAAGNTGDGISAGPLTPGNVTGTSIDGCHSNFNEGDGIQVFQRCSVKDNCCSGNGVLSGGVGIRVLEQDNAIEGNTVNRSGGAGILVMQATNLIIGNRAKNNTPNYSIAFPNDCTVGTIVQSTLGGDINAATNSLINIGF